MNLQSIVIHGTSEALVHLHRSNKLTHGTLSREWESLSHCREGINSINRVRRGEEERRGEK